MATGTNYKGGISFRTKYSGNADSVNNYERRAKTKPVHKTATIHFDGADAAGEFNTGLTIKAPFMIHSVAMNTVTAQSSVALSLGGNAASGAGDDPDGLIASSEVTAGFRPAKGYVVTVGTNESYFAAPALNALTYAPAGVLLATLVAGSDVTTDVGTLVEHPYIGSVDMPITITTGGAITGTCDFIIEYTEFVQEDK